MLIKPIKNDIENNKVKKSYYLKLLIILYLINKNQTYKKLEHFDDNVIK